MSLKIDIKGVNECDFVNYKKASMFIIFPHCDFKCEKDCGQKICQNNSLTQTPTISVEISSLVNKYLNNPLTTAIVCGGLEPLDSWEQLAALITSFRIHTLDDIIIYTGYKEEEVSEAKINFFKNMKNIIIKYGRYIPNQTSHYDNVLGVYLASDNQYAKRMEIRDENNSIT